MTRRIPGFICPRFLRATGFETPSHTVILSRCKFSNEYSEGSVLSRYSSAMRFLALPRSSQDLADGHSTPARILHGMIPMPSAPPLPGNGTEFGCNRLFVIHIQNRLSHASTGKRQTLRAPIWQ